MMKDIKNTLYVSDLDGTLLNSNSTLSDETVSCLNRLINERNINFTVATARTPATVTHIMRDVHTRLPFIVMAGAAQWDNKLYRYRNVRTIDNVIIEQLLSVFSNKTVNPFIYRRHDSCIYAHHIHRLTDSERQFISVREIPTLKHIIYDDELEAYDKDGTMLVLGMGRFDELREIADEIDSRDISCTYMCYHDIFDETQGFLEIYAVGTTKAAAIRQMASEIRADRIVVFGDNLNDIPMMEVADCSVAVSNAFEDVKRAACEITGSNDDNAVVHWIENDCRRQ